MKWSEALRKKCCPIRIVEVAQAGESWIFPTPWIEDSESESPYKEYCCFPLPGAEPRLFVKITTKLVDEYGSENHAHGKRDQIHREDSGLFVTTFHADFPPPRRPAAYGIQVLPPIEDPEGNFDKSDPAWDGFGQWLGHKIGGAPFLRDVGLVSEQAVRDLLSTGYELLLQLGEPNWSIEDPRLCDDYQEDCLFQKDRFCVLIHPATMEVCYVWG